MLNGEAWHLHRDDKSEDNDPSMKAEGPTPSIEEEKVAHKD